VSTIKVPILSRLSLICKSCLLFVGNLKGLWKHSPTTLCSHSISHSLKFPLKRHSRWKHGRFKYSKLGRNVTQYMFLFIQRQGHGGRVPKKPWAATAITSPRQLACPARNQATSPSRHAPPRHLSHLSQIAQCKENK